MIQIAGYSLAVALASIIVGLPITAIRRSSLSHPLDALFDSFATGLVALVVGLTLLNWLGGIWFVLILAVVLGVIGATLRRQGFSGLPSVRWRIDAWTTATVVVLCGATLIRLRSVNFISRGGDAGGYVNWANEYARTGVLDAGFPPLFSMYLGIASRLFGSANTTATVPLLGVFLLLAVLRLLSQLEAQPVVKVAALLLVGFHTHAVWYSSFPLSEALQAPLLVMFLSNVVAVCKAPREVQPVGELITLGLTALALGLCRVTAPLLLVPMVALPAISVIRPWRSFTSPVAAAVATATAGVSLGYIYGITAIRQYYVGNQIGGTLPESVVDRMDRLGLLDVTPALVGLIALALGALVAVAWATRPRSGWTGPPPGGDAMSSEDPTLLHTWWWPLPVAVVLIVAGKLVVDSTAGSEVNGQLHRIGYPLLILAGLAMLVPRGLRGARGITSIFGAVVAMSMVVLNDRRLDGPMPHGHFLYWDRYLFSEMFPMVVVIVALGATGALEWTTDRFPGRRGGWPSAPTLLVGTVPLALAAAAILSTLATVRVMNYDETLDNTYELERDIVRLMPDSDAPVLWTSNTAAPPGSFFFPNTWYSLGTPLRMTFGRDVVNIASLRDPFAPELMITNREMAAAVGCSADAKAYVVEIDTGGKPLDERLTDRRLDIAKVGRAEYRIPSLKQPRDYGWYYSDVKADVYEVTGRVTPTTPCTGAA